MRRSIATSMLTSVLLLAAAGCGDDAETATHAGADPGSGSATTAADCATMIPDSVVSALSWQSGGAATLDSGTCTRTTAQGSLSTQRRPVGAVGDGDLAAAATRAYRQRCGELDDGAGAKTVSWTSGVQECAATSSAGDGVNVLLTLTPDHLLVESRVSPDQPTDRALVQQALVALAGNTITTVSG